jgi:hypothetical protein
MALRLNTRGWNLFHMPGLPVHHLYNDAGLRRRGRCTGTQEAERDVSWWAYSRGAAGWRPWWRVPTWGVWPGNRAQPADLPLSAASTTPRGTLAPAAFVPRSN